MTNKRKLFLIIILIGCLAAVSSDIYAPALPSIADSLGAHVNFAQWSMVIFMLGMAISQLVYGPLSEGIGRRRPLLIGMSIMMLGTIVCFFAPNITVLILGRLLQGLGAGASATLWRSIFRDTYEGAELAKYGSYLAIFITFIIPAAPTLGGYLDQYFGWRSIFIFILIYTCAAIITVFFAYKETSKHHHLDRLKPRFITKTFACMLSSRVFMGYTLCAFLSFGAFFSWFTAGPVLLIKYVGISPVEFGWLTFIGGGAMTFLAGLTNGKLVSKLGIPFMLRSGFTIMFIAGCLMLILYFTLGVTTASVITPVFIFYFGVMLVFPNTFASAFAPFGKIAGYAGALYGFIQTSGAFVIGGLVSHLPDTNQLPLAFIFMIAPIIAWGVFEFTRQPAINS